MSRPLTLDEFNQLIAIIQDKHCFGGKNWKPENVAIKYVTPIFDMRTNEFYCITFEMYGHKHTLHCVNDCRDLEQSLFDRCIDFLNTPNI
jgi:hypothetical protein